MNDNIESRTPLTETDIVIYLSKLCDRECEYTPLECNTEDFRPYKMFNAIIDNPDYDPDNYSQEIEDSEEDKTEVAWKFFIENFDPIRGWHIRNGELEFAKIRNSPKWRENHSKKCPTKLDFNIVNICEASTKTVYEKRIEDGQIKRKEIAQWRDYNNEDNQERLFNYLQKKREEGINVYVIQ